LIVEDEYLVALQMEGALADAGYEIGGIASSAEEAVRIAETQPPTLVVMDIRLVGKRDGIDAALELFSRFGVRCVFASAHQDKEARDRAEPANPLGWLPKPYSMTALLDAVENAHTKLQDESA
jgi:DNA-binding NarL/FixJ family response regulator